MILVMTLKFVLLAYVHLKPCFSKNSAQAPFLSSIAHIASLECHIFLQAFGSKYTRFLLHWMSDMWDKIRFFSALSMLSGRVIIFWFSKYSKACSSYSKNFFFNSKSLIPVLAPFSSKEHEVTTEKVDTTSSDWKSFAGILESVLLIISPVDEGWRAAELWDTEQSRKPVLPAVCFNSQSLFFFLLR